MYETKKYEDSSKSSLDIQSNLKKIKTIKNCDSFGAFSIDSLIRTSTAICNCFCEIILLSRKDYEEIFTSETQKESEKLRFFKNCFPELNFNLILFFSCSFEEIKFDKDHIIFKEGDKADEFFLIYEGEIGVLL